MQSVKDTLILIRIRSVQLDHLRTNFSILRHLGTIDLFRENWRVIVDIQNGDVQL